MMANDLKIEDFRVQGWLGFYKIQRKKVSIIKTGFLFWKKKEKVTTWRSVDKYGEYIYVRAVGWAIDTNSFEMMKVFENPIQAWNMILMLCEDEKYYYLASNNEKTQ